MLVLKKDRFRGIDGIHVGGFVFVLLHARRRRFPERVDESSLKSECCRWMSCRGLFRLHGDCSSCCDVDVMHFGEAWPDKCPSPLIGSSLLLRSKRVHLRLWRRHRRRDSTSECCRTTSGKRRRIERLVKSHGVKAPTPAATTAVVVVVVVVVVIHSCLTTCNLHSGQVPKYIHFRITVLGTWIAQGHSVLFLLGARGRHDQMVLYTVTWCIGSSRRRLCYFFIFRLFLRIRTFFFLTFDWISVPEEERRRAFVFFL
mmetsp:Transcript_8725/g.23432  ORF Transcript_8725/g.23432 Transcript_8725/m.23432 type:complete len:257 (-) Transcript_8725:213-983(-)